MVIILLDTPVDRLVISVEFAQSVPASVFAYWTKPDLLCEWWPQEAEVDPRPGGSYHLSWPQMNWHLRGHYTVFEPGKLLAFTWKWDHDEQGEPERNVMIVFEPFLNSGTKLTLTHGLYADTPEEQELRINHHLAGWQHFLPRLRSLIEDS